MSMRAEIPHNTQEQVRLYIGAALELVETLEVPEDLREAAFNQAAQMLAAKQIFQEPPRPAGVDIPRMDMPRGRNNHR